MFSISLDVLFSHVIEIMQLKYITRKLLFIFNVGIILVDFK